MVKRQTVWLSTMMVLSLMLIGYYTMNNGAQSTTKTAPGASVTTSAGTPPNTSSSQLASSTSSPSTSTSTSESTSASSSVGTASTDFFIKLQTQLDQELSRQEDVYSQVISSNNASANQMTQAEDQLKQLETLIGEIGNARDAVMGEGYKACVIVPDLKTNQATVYVKSTNLSASDAVSVMNIVSQNLNIPINNVVVNKHA